MLHMFISTSQLYSSKLYPLRKLGSFPVFLMMSIHRVYEHDNSIDNNNNTYPIIGYIIWSTSAPFYNPF